MKKAKEVKDPWEGRIKLPTMKKKKGGEEENGEKNENPKRNATERQRSTPSKGWIVSSKRQDSVTH